MTLVEAQLKAVEEQRDNLKHDLDNTHLAKDELMKKVSGWCGREGEEDRMGQRRG